jgi:tyrosine-protein kinase Etk/Wzc
MQLHTNHSEKKENNFFSSVMFRYLPYWPLFLIMTLLSLAVAWVYLRYTTPVYEASATILIKDEKKGVDEASVLEALQIPDVKKIVENEIEVLRSKKLMNEVVKHLHLYAPLYEESGTKAKAAYAVSPVTIEAKKPDDIAPTENVYFTVDPAKGVIINNKTYAFNQWVSTPYGELRFVPKSKAVQGVPERLSFRLVPLKEVSSALVGNLKVQSAGKLSTVVNLKLRDEVPKRAEDVLNMLVSSYNQTSVNDKNSLASNTLAFIESRLNGVVRELDSIEGRIQQYRADKGAINLSEQGKYFLQSVGENDKKVSEVNIQLSILDQVERYVVMKDNKSGILPSTLGLNDPLLTQLLQKLYDAEIEYDKLRKTTGEKNPLMVPLANEIEQIRPQILESIRTQRNNLVASKNNLSSTSGMYNAMLYSLPQKERELTEISRQHLVKNNVYSFLLEKREQTAMAISSTVPDTKIVDVASSSESPVSPQRTFVYMVALIIALGLSIGLISAKEILNKKVLFRSEIESFTAIPIVAEISYTPERESLSNTASKVSFAAEQFRQLRTAMGIYGSQTNHNKKILVTSSIAGEGKSYISINLAISLALASKKVILVDLDIRSPKVSSVFSVSSKAGIADYLEGTADMEEIIWKTAYENLYTIGAGSDIENARELILSGKFSNLLSYLETRYDYVIMDTSPINPITDAYVFSQYCDITLFIVRHRYTPKTIIQLLDNNNKIKGLKNPCIIFNDVRSRGLFGGKYGYGYGYGYESVYREINKRDSAKLLEA